MAGFDVSGIGASAITEYAMQQSKNASAEAVKNKVQSTSAKSSDDELWAACKSFEAYLIERVMTKTKEAIIPSDENENKYLTMFKGKLYEEYANQIAENGELGIAQQLYEAMRRDYGRPSAK